MHLQHFCGCVFVVDLLLVLSKWLSGRTRYTAEVIVSSQINAWFIKPASNYHAAGTALALCLLFHITVSCALFTPFSPIRLPAILMKMKKKTSVDCRPDKQVTLWLPAADQTI